MKYLIDANILIQPFLKQDKSEKCAELLNKMDYGEIEGIITVFHLDAAGIVLENKGMNKEDLAQLYYRIYDSEGLEARYTGISARLNALADEKHQGIDDSLISQAFDELEAEKIVSYDTDFDKERRTTPEKILQNMDSED
jgi:predicted nucleic acid-binding protein